MKRYHFIAIGGSAMHNLAIAIHKSGNKVTGSDDEVFDPAKSRLEKYGLLPDKTGWFPEKITNNIDTVILGMHARKDNPELLKAQEIGLKICSYPEFLYEQSKDKIRVVIGGSHGKTTITSMLLHILEHNGKKFDYMVGAQLDGFEVMVKITDDAPIMIIEGDEYLTSPIDLRPKFHVYQPNIGLINGIAWDHINVFPTFDIYVEQFKIFADKICKNGALAYYVGDSKTKNIGEYARDDIKKYPYDIPSHKIENNITVLLHNGKEYPLQVFGKHNLQNLAGAWAVCKELDLSDDDVLNAITSFRGASKRLEIIQENDTSVVYKDFAHSPSKLRATVCAVKEQYPERHLVACMELHTFSSLTKEFLREYRGCINDADTALIYFNPHTIEHKKLLEITIEMVKEAFAREDLQVFTSNTDLEKFLNAIEWKNTNLLLMSSGNFGQMSFVQS